MVSVLTTPIAPSFVARMVSLAPTGSRLPSKPFSRTEAAVRARSVVRVQRLFFFVRQEAVTRAPGWTSATRLRSVVPRPPAVNE